MFAKKWFDKKSLIRIRFTVNRFISRVQFVFIRLRMITVNKFCLCWKLETGGIVVGWFGIITSLVLGVALIGSIAFDFQDVVDYIKQRFALRDATQQPIMSNYSFHLHEKTILNEECSWSYSHRVCCHHRLSTNKSLRINVADKRNRKREFLLSSFILARRLNFYLLEKIPTAESK